MTVFDKVSELCVAILIAAGTATASCLAFAWCLKLVRWAFT